MTPSFSQRPLPLRRSIAILLAIGAASFPAPSASGAALVWDANLGLIGAQDGSGTWETTANNWVNGPWADTNDATFGAGADGTYAINVNLNPIATSLIFNNSGYALSAAAPQT